MALRWLARLSTLLALVSFAPPQLAQGDGSTVVARVGTAELRAPEVARRWRAMPSHQQAALGATPERARGRLVHEVLVVELLHDQAVREQRLEQEPAVANAVREALRRGLEQQLRDRVEREHPVTDEEVQSYYEANRARFGTPARLRLWRILVEDEQLARTILSDAQGRNGPLSWANHAREHSLDKATSMRKGDLGFVHRDGRTDAPRVRVDPALFAAAEPVADGALVPDPVREGSRYAVVWRRGSLPETRRSVEQEAAAIRRILLASRVREAVDALVLELHRRHVSAVNESLLDRLELAPPSFAPLPRSSGSDRVPPAASASPSPGERGLR